MIPLPRLLCVSKTFHKYISPHLGYKPSTDQKVLSDICRIIDPIHSDLPGALAAIISRHSDWSDNIPFQILRPITEPTMIPSLEDIFHERAQTLLSHDRPIKVFWSGGIDSTLALTYLLYHSKKPQDITVCCTADSFKDNYNYQDFLDKFPVKIERLEYSWKYLNSPESIIVTGNSADRLLATLSERFYVLNASWMDGPWSEFLEYKGMSKDHIEYCVNKIPADVVTVMDLCWWMNFYFCIQSTLLMDHWDNNLENPLSDTISFFDHTHLDQWSIQNRHEIIVDRKWSSYKWQYKKAIYEIWPDQDFLENKIKTHSMVSRNRYFKKKNYHDQNYVLIYLDKDNVARTYRPPQLPMIDIEYIRQDLARLSNE